MNRAHQKTRNCGAAVKCILLLSLLPSLVGLLRPFPADAADCSVSWDLSAGGCKSDCMKSGVYCSLLDSKSWCSNSTNDCATEAAKPANPPNGSYSMNCSNNTWSLSCNTNFTTCDGSTCQANITLPNCSSVNQCAGKCASCSGGYTTCDGGSTCQLNTTMAHCDTLNQCTGKCSTCSGGYTTCDGGNTCHANITLPNCTTVDQCTDLCTACGNGYTLSGGACVGATLKLSGNSVGSGSPFYIYQSAEPAPLNVTAAGKVGISTGNPSYPLHVASVAGDAGTLLAVSTGATNVFWAAGDGAHATRFFGDGSGLTGLGAGDNLGNHIATKMLNMSAFDIVNIGNLTANSDITAYSTMTVAGNAFSVGGTALVVSGGNVGIGTASPPAALSLGTAGSSPSWPNLFFGNYPISGGAQIVGNWSSADYWGIGPLTGSGDNTLRIGNSADRTGTWSLGQNLNLVIGGNIGIGTDAPAAALDVNGAAKISRYLTQADNAGITLTAADFGKTITVNSASAQTVTLPSVTASDIGAQFTIIKFGAGQVTIQAAGGTYIADSTAGGTIYNNLAAETYATITLRLTTGTNWSILGGNGSWTTN